MIKFELPTLELSHLLTGDYFYLKLAIVTLLFCQTIRRLQSGPLQFYYNQKDPLMSAFIEKSNVKKLVFKPYFICLSSCMQLLVYLLLESLYRVIARPKTE